MGGYYQAVRDFGADFDDGEVLMSPVGSVYLLHLDRTGGRGEIEKWSFVSQESSYIFRGGCYGACSMWNEIRKTAFPPNVDQLRLAQAPMAWWTHARRH